MMLAGLGITRRSTCWCRSAPWRWCRSATSPTVPRIGAGAGGRAGAPNFPRLAVPFIGMFAVANSALINMLMASRLLYGLEPGRACCPSVLGRVHVSAGTLVGRCVLFTTALAFGRIYVVTTQSQAQAVSLLGTAPPRCLLLCVFTIVSILADRARRRPSSQTGPFPLARPAAVDRRGELRLPRRPVGAQQQRWSPQYRIAALAARHRCGAVGAHLRPGSASSGEADGGMADVEALAERHGDESAQLKADGRWLRPYHADQLEGHLPWLVFLVPDVLGPVARLQAGRRSRWRPRLRGCARVDGAPVIVARMSTALPSVDARAFTFMPPGE